MTTNFCFRPITVPVQSSFYRHQERRIIGHMLTADELAALQSLLARASVSAAQTTVAAIEALAPGDVVQLRPGIDRTWESSLLLVMRTDGGYRCRGQILRPHRSGCAEAWYQFRPGEVVRIGRLPYPEPAPDIRAWTYCPPCPIQQRKPPTLATESEFTTREITGIYRDLRAADAAALIAEKLRTEVNKKSRSGI